MIITINRQFGSGGREVGKRLADALKCAYYDEELLVEITRKTGLSIDYINLFDEKATRSFGYTFGRTLSSFSQHSPTDKLQLEFTKLIKQIGKNGNAVIVGRCADYILQDEQPFKVFVFASDMDFRVNRCFDKKKEDKKAKSKAQMTKEIKAVDKQREKYYEYYTALKWKDMSHYNLCVDSSRVSIMGAVDIILKAIEFNK